MKRLGATKRGNDEIEAKEKEIIGQKKMGIVDQRCHMREETRRGDKNWTSFIEENASHQKQKRDILVEQTAYRRQSHRKEIGDGNQNFISSSS